MLTTSLLSLHHRVIFDFLFITEYSLGYFKEYFEKINYGKNRMGFNEIGGKRVG